MLYATSYLLILTEQGPFFTPRNPSCCTHFIFPPPDHSLSPPSHRAGQSCPGPTSLHRPAAGQTDLRPPAPRQWHVCHPSPSSCTSLLPTGAEGRRVGSPAPCIWHRDPTHAPCSEPRGGQPPLPHTLTLGERVSPTPCSLQPQEGSQEPAKERDGGRRERRGLLPGRGAARWTAGSGSGRSHQPCHPARRVEKVQSKAFSVPAGQPAVPIKHRAPKSKEPGLSGGFAWKTGVMSFVSGRGCTSLPHSRGCARDFEMAQVRCRIWGVVMDGPGQ